MRLLAVLLLVSSLALSIGAEPIKFSQETHPNYYEDIPVTATVKHSENLLKRTKRSVLAAIGITSQCEDGWGGPYCENPICQPSNIVPQLSSYENRQIDLLYLPSGCTGKYYIPVDSMLATNILGLNINVHADGIPYINLTDSNGNLMAATGYGASQTFGYASYPSSMPPGAYQLTIDNGGVPTTKCSVIVEIFSRLATSNGFTMSPQSDVLPYAESGMEQTPMYFVTHAYNVSVPGQVRSVTIRKAESTTPIYKSVLTSRYSCAYEFYAGQFSCVAGEHYTVHVDGVDSNGYPWRRSSSFGCMSLPTTTPAPTTTTPFRCNHGGTPLFVGTGNDTCFCPELWSGKQCQIAACMNGGTINPGGADCLCPDGYWGDNCEHVTCDPNFSQYLTEQKTLVIVIRNTVSMTLYSKAIISAIQTEMESNDGLKDGLYSNFVLVRYGDDGYLEKYYPATGYAAFINDLQMIQNSTLVGNCSDTVFNALYASFGLFSVYERSPILHFTDAVASDDNNWRLVTEANSRRNLPIQTFFFPQSGCNFDELSPGYRALRNAGLFSGGMNYLIDPSNVASLQALVLSVMRSTTKNMNLVYANDLDRCVPNVQRSFMIDSSANSVIIIATGKNLLFTMVDPDNNNAVKNYLPMYFDNYNYVWEVQVPKVGEYVFSISAADQQNPCSVRVVSQSTYDFFFATTFFPTWDASDSVPVVNQPIHLVAQLNGLYNATRDPLRLFAELTITTNRNLENNMPGKPMYYSNGQYRDGCGYHLYFGVANFCEFDNQPFYATIFADDNNGFTIQRTAISFCSITNTTTTQPGTCQNGGVIDPSTNDTCICQVGFTGDSCQTIVCQNGGTPAGSYCLCLTGSTGTFCEMYTCPLANLMPDASFNGQTMVFVVATRPTMQATWDLLSSSVSEFVRDAQTHSPDWIKEWVLITTNAATSQKIVVSYNPQDFVDGIKMVAANLTNYIDGDDNCQVEIMEGLLYGVYLSTPGSSIYLFTDASGPDDAINFSPLYTLSTDNQITINIIQTTNNLCTPDGGMPDYIQDLAYMTNGFFYITPQVNKILPYITTMYMSGVSGSVAAADCSASAISWIAVDSMTQGITVAVIGSNLTLEVDLPNGLDTNSYYYEVQLVTEPNLLLRQYMAPCEAPGWAYYQQICLHSSLNIFTWWDAARYCHSLSGSIVDINNDAKDSKISSETSGMNNWIGLIRNGNSWTWDVPDGNVAHPLGPNDYTRWCTDGTWPDPDPTKNCVYMTGSGCWKNDDCNNKNLFVCQRHRFGQGFYPDDPTVNAVPPGRWRVKVSGQGACWAQVRSQSAIQVFYGFTNDPHDDFPQTFANYDSSTNYIAALPTGLSAFQPDGIYTSMEGNLNYALIGYNYSLTNPLTMTNRPFCGYSYISQPFTCPQMGSSADFFIKFSGIDQFGYPFDRYVDANCNRYIQRCFNGGFSNNGACVCAPGYTGANCYTPICQNGGKDDGGGKCNCDADPLFGGTFCDQPKCEPPYPAVFGDTGKTLVILLETSFGMTYTIYNMQQNLKTALDNIQKDPTTAGWFNKFILYPFDSAWNKDYWYPAVYSSNSDDIIDGLSKIQLNGCPGPNGNNSCSTFCPRPYLNILEEVLSNQAYFSSPNSVVLIITRSSPEDAERQDSLNQLLQETKAQVNFVLPGVGSPCGLGWNTNEVRPMYQTVQYSDGNIFVMNPGDVVLNFIQKYIPTLYKSAGLESAQLQNCGTNDILFQVEHEMYEFTIDAYLPIANPPFTITLTDPDNNVVMLPQSLITSDSNYLGVIQVNDTGATKAGTYQLSIRGGNGQGYCYINIRGRSSIEIYPGFVKSNDGYNGAITDSAHYAPVYLELNTIVVHAAGLSDVGGNLLYAQFIEPDGIGLYHTTQLKRRESKCSYEYYGNVPVDWQYETLLVVVYGRDGRGANFHRNYIVTGVGSRPKPPPPPQSCTLWTAKQDIVFMIDSSLKNDQRTFNVLKSFAANVMHGYYDSSGATQAQMAALTVSDKAYGGFSFLASNSWSTFNTIINNLTYSAQNGQNTAAGFNYIIANMTSSNQGYRSDSNVRHSIFYLTNTDPTDVDPGQVPIGIRRSGMFGIAVLAYATNVTSAMRSIVNSDDCIYQAPTLDDLNNYGMNFIRQFSCYNRPICGM